MHAYAHKRFSLAWTDSIMRKNTTYASEHAIHAHKRALTRTHTHTFSGSGPAARCAKRRHTQTKAQCTHVHTHTAQGLDRQPGGYSIQDFIHGSALAVHEVFPGVHHASFCMLDRWDGLGAQAHARVRVKTLGMSSWTRCHMGTNAGAPACVQTCACVHVRACANMRAHAHKQACVHVCVGGVGVGVCACMHACACVCLHVCDASGSLHCSSAQQAAMHCQNKPSPTMPCPDS